MGITRQIDPMEEFLQHSFDENFEHLKRESAHTIPPALKELAWQQVLLYWRKLKDIAEKVTETEVKLTLPEQTTPASRRYTIEGVVDIVKEDDKVIMYDLKTHEAEQVRAFQDLYAKQLNVYAHIWQNLRGQNLDNIAIIATAPPQSLLDALASGDPNRLSVEMKKWDPVVNLDFDQGSLDECINDFGITVDKIEDGQFCAPFPAKLKEQMPGRKVHFGTAVCRYCDARFCCNSYRRYVQGMRPNAKGFQAMRFYLEDYGDESDRNQWLEATLGAQRETEEE
ncbi:MAG: PD-(D/E)XK nuclease family protein [Desulfobacteria bacterium]